MLLKLANISNFTFPLIAFTLYTVIAIVSKHVNCEYTFFKTRSFGIASIRASGKKNSPPIINYFKIIKSLIIGPRS